ncbi:CBS domain-containing protein [Streptomyces sp. NBC_00878]|uniref:CBS domain-containing protein n=1 Tax=Streptomyces sp. NBC_00878 TaxID=2975854 RepID=UPI0022525C32|nr:CBS domain-containing protein [Streptomyces sp. NBC_00878]MCX4909559.1 CBS domain-containing protein [Streptomyces sp. NBC_00878]
MPTEEQLLGLKGTMLPVPDLLALFGTRVRNDQTVLDISQALKTVGLSTVPYFATCNRRAKIHVVALASVVEETGSEIEGVDADESEDGYGLSQGALPQRSFRIGDIPGALHGVESVTPDDQLTTATYIMRTKNYSQLPVLDGHYTLRGVVTWSSVARMYETGADPILANAMAEHWSVAEAHQDFFSLLPMVSEHGYLLVRDSSGKFRGIVTAADVTQRFGATAWPFFAVGDIEFRLRKCLGTKLGPEAILAVQPDYKQTGQITDLMFGDYVKLLDGNPRSAKQREQQRAARADQNWLDLGWPGVDRVQFVHQLDRVRQIRNKIAHFDPDPLSQQLTDELRQFVGLLRQLT